MKPSGKPAVRITANSHEWETDGDGGGKVEEGHHRWVGGVDRHAGDAGVGVDVNNILQEPTSVGEAALEMMRELGGGSRHLPRRGAADDLVVGVLEGKWSCVACSSSTFFCVAGHAALGYKYPRPRC